MPDQDLTGFSRVCPSCGRRVPRNVAKCRCGAEIPAESSGVTEVDFEKSSTGSTVIVGLVIAVLLIGAGYWTFLRPSPAVPRAERAEENDAAPEAAPAARSATPPPADSAERRAWDAAASAQPLDAAAAGIDVAGNATPTRRADPAEPGQVLVRHRS